MKPANDISKMLEAAPRNCWLAFNDDQSALVAHGETLAEVAAAAKQKGVDEPVLLWAPAEWITQVY